MKGRRGCARESLVIWVRRGPHRAPWWGLTGGESGPTGLEELGGSISLPNSPSKCSEEKKIRKMSEGTQERVYSFWEERRGAGEQARLGAQLLLGLVPGPPLHLHFLHVKWHSNHHSHLESTCYGREYSSQALASAATLVALFSARGRRDGAGAVPAVGTRSLHGRVSSPPGRESPELVKTLL